MAAEPLAEGVIPDRVVSHLRSPLPRRPRRSAPLRFRRVHPVVRPDWEGRYVHAVAISDVLSVLLITSVGVLAGERLQHVPGVLAYGIGPATTVTVLVALSLARAWDPLVLGQGSQEYRRLLRAFAATSVAGALIGLALKEDSFRPWVFGLVPLAFFTATGARWCLRKVLHRRRFAGRCTHSVLAVGAVDAVADLIERTRRDQTYGWVVDAACTPTGTGQDAEADILGVPVLGDLDSVSSAVLTGAHHIVSVSAAPGWSPARLHQLAWDVEEAGSELVVDPRLMEVAGPRLHVAPVDGLPLLRLTRPTLSGGSRVVKAVVDTFGAVASLVLMSPLMIGLALLIKLDGGPVFYRQTRVGRDGKPFEMIKFRSMLVGADAVRPAENDGSGPLYKLRRDPRVTSVGSWMRRYSVDELPQLINVLTGSMSLVGPRPPLPDEVAAYTRGAHRKFLVKPGLTGLWQVSGRSDLTWEQSVRLDLRYVENWSLMQDAQILWKTFGAVIGGSGAY